MLENILKHQFGHREQAYSDARAECAPSATASAMREK